MLLSVVRAALVGALLCTVAQILLDRTNLTPARILVIYVVFGVFLGSVGLYRPLYAFAGSGASVPLIGYGALIADGVREAVDSEGFFGIFTGTLSRTAGGIAAALVFGYVFSVFFRGKPKSLAFR